MIAVDRKREPGRPVQCAEFVPAIVGIDVGDLAASTRQRIRSMLTFVERDAPDVKENFPGHMLDRAAFDAALVASAEAAGAACRFGAGVRRIHSDGVASSSPTAGQIAAGVVVGADGPRSVAGRAIGQVNAELVETRQITVPLARPHEATDIYLSADIPGGYGWMFPKGDVANLGAGVDPASKRRLKDIVARLHASLVESGQVGSRILGLTGGLIPVGGMLKPCRHARAYVSVAGRRCGGAHEPGDRGGDRGRRPFGPPRRTRRRPRGRQATERRATPTRKSSTTSSRPRSTARCAAAASSRRPGRADKAALRRGWIAYPEYWTT